MNATAEIDQVEAACRALDAACARQEFEASMERLRHMGDNLVCKGEASGIDACETAKAHETCPMAKARSCPRRMRWEDQQEAKRQRDQRLHRFRNFGVPERVTRVIASGAITETEALQTSREFLRDPRLCFLGLAAAPGVAGKTTAPVIAAWQEGIDPLFMTAGLFTCTNRFDRAEMDNLGRVPLLIIDDLGTEFVDARGAFASLFDTVVNARYSACVKTIVTCNMTAKEFRSRYGARLADRWRESGRFVEFTGASLRSGK